MKRIPLMERFAKYVARGEPDACWLWTGSKTKAGYGNVRIQGKTNEYAHRLAWRAAHNGREIPAGMVIRHACDNPGCVNPAHLSLGTHADNVADKVSRNRQAGPRRLTVDAVVSIRAELAAGQQLKVLARKHGICSAAVAKIRDRKMWKNVP